MPTRCGTCCVKDMFNSEKTRALQYYRFKYSMSQRKLCLSLLHRDERVSFGCAVQITKSTQRLQIFPDGVQSFVWQSVRTTLRKEIPGFENKVILLYYEKKSQFYNNKVILLT